jgi:hypothetical protein
MSGVPCACAGAAKLAMSRQIAAARRSMTRDRA